jgi:thioredoxin 1
MTAFQPKQKRINMTQRMIFGALVGATVGFGIGLLSSRTGGTCPILCNPYIAAGLGLFIGGMFASSGASSVRDYTPSPHLAQIKSEERFQETVLNSDRPVLVEFGYPGCHFCRKLEPTMHELADQFADRATVAKVNTRKLPEVTRRYGVKGVPALFLFKDGELVEHLVGYREKKVLQDLLEEHVTPVENPVGNGSPA